MPEVKAATATDLGLASLEGAADPRLGTAVGRLARHAHSVALDLRPTPEELLCVAAFLAEVGLASDARRQEMILLSDVLGVSALVEAINGRRPAGATPNTLPDPFYVPDAPARSDDADICLAGGGEALAVEGSVRDIEGRPVPKARVETWQANAEGHYDIQRPDELPEHNLRGSFQTDAQGRFTYHSIRPGPVAVPSDGPVGALLARLGRGTTTPAHVCLRVTAPGFETLTTQIFDAHDPTLADDALFAVRRGLTVPFEREGARWRVRPELRLAPRNGAAR